MTIYGGFLTNFIMVQNLLNEEQKQLTPMYYVDISSQIKQNMFNFICGT